MIEKINSALFNAEMSAIRIYSSIAKSTPGCVMLTIGEPDFDTPDIVKAEAKLSLDRGETGYPEGNGNLFLRSAIADFERTKNGLNYSQDEIIVTAGATGALFLSLFGIIEPGDEIIVPTPAFGLYESIIKACRGVFVPLDISSTGFQIDESALSGLLTDRTKAILLNSPNNPSGCVLNDKSLDIIEKVAIERDLFVITDEVYRQLIYLDRCPVISGRPSLRDRTLVVQSFSKPYAMTGWRVGYLMTDKALIDHLQKINQFTIVSVTSFIQHACVKALQFDPTDMINAYHSRRDYVCKRLSDMGLDVPTPEGAFYVFPSIEKFGITSDTFCRRIIPEAGVAVVPGSCFGTEGRIRISYCNSQEQIKEGLDRLERFIKTL